MKVTAGTTIGNTMNHCPNQVQRLPIEEYLHPVSIVALCTLALNDHWLKYAEILPGWLTGKLSDVAGMIFFPLLLTALWNTTRWVGNRIMHRNETPPAHNICLSRRQIVVAILFTATILILLQVSPATAHVYLQAMAFIGLPSQVTADPTDLVAVFAAPVPYYIGMKVVNQQPLTAK